MLKRPFGESSNAVQNTIQNKYIKYFNNTRTPTSVIKWDNMVIVPLKHFVKVHSVRGTSIARISMHI